MLYPDFAELIKLQSKARALTKLNNYRSISCDSGNSTSIFRGHGMEFEDVRPYVFGDDVRYIDWRVTARSQKTHVKTYQTETDLNIIICLDNNTWMQFGTRGTFKSVQAAKAAALLGWSALYNNDKLGCYIYGNLNTEYKYYPARKSKRQLWEMFKLLSNKQDTTHTVSTKDALNKLLNLCKKRSIIFLLTDLSQLEAVDIELGSLSHKHELIVLPIIDPFDISLPNTGIFTCINNEQKLMVNTTSRSARQNYAKSWQDLNHNINSILRKFSITRIDLFTNQDVYRALSNGLKSKRLIKNYAAARIT